MGQEDYRKGAWALPLLYPLAALLALGAASHGGFPQYFQRDWPFILGGPIGVVVWWLIATTWRSWPAFVGGYFVGAIACALVVAVLEWIARSLKKRWD